MSFLKLASETSATLFWHYSYCYRFICLIISIRWISIHLWTTNVACLKMFIGDRPPPVTNYENNIMT